jgi:hypothetical protein
MRLRILVCWIVLALLILRVPALAADRPNTTFATGKWHNGPESIPRSFQAARSIFAGGMTDPLHAPLSNLEQGKLTAPKFSRKHACQVFD